MYRKRRRQPVAIVKRGGRCTRNGVTYYKSKKDGKIHKSKSRDEDAIRNFYR